jgi:anti-sigma regulatory factor (Ser/Thr protein kinase)
VIATSALLVPHAATSAGIVRHRCVDELRARGVSPTTVYDAALVLSELVGNAVRHGAPLPGGGIEVRWQVAEQHVRLEVRDGGRGPRRSAAAAACPAGGSADAESGRGLGIAAILTSSWGSAYDADEAVVWADIPVPAHVESACSMRTEQRWEA